MGNEHAVKLTRRQEAVRVEGPTGRPTVTAHPPSTITKSLTVCSSVVAVNHAAPHVEVFEVYLLSKGPHRLQLCLKFGTPPPRAALLPYRTFRTAESWSATALLLAECPAPALLCASCCRLGAALWDPATIDPEPGELADLAKKLKRERCFSGVEDALAAPPGVTASRFEPSVF
mmetsp:Transcript_59346/g.121574  ORF Transcript_59346/g.121574 Transcript_59346/m.121574 type:complete len:174 (-) Transcript_59346:592-1113(-)